jgi:hypothetical protein
MRFENYLNDKSSFLKDYLVLCESLELNELKDDTLKKLSQAGKKIGFKVKRSKSLVDYFKGINTGVEDLLRYAALFMLTDIKDNASRKELTQDAKQVFKRIKKKDVTNMLLQIDKSTVGVSSHIRHIFQSAFGIEVTSYTNWLKDAEYISNTLKDMKITLKRMGDTDAELQALAKFERSLQGLVS